MNVRMSVADVCCAKTRKVGRSSPAVSCSKFSEAHLFRAHFLGFTTGSSVFGAQM